MTEYQKKIHDVLTIAVTHAITEMEITEFKKCSFFMSNCCK